MSVKRRKTFKFASDEDSEDDRVVLDEQEQEEVIDRLKQESVARNAQYLYLLHAVVALSALLHVIYLMKTTKESPFVAIIPSHGPTTSSLPLANLHTLLHLFLHANLTAHIFPSNHHVRSSLASISSNLPLPYYVVFVASVLAPALSLLLRQSWAEILWWTTTPVLVWFVYSAQKWMKEEDESIRRLEGMRYDARGA